MEDWLAGIGKELEAGGAVTIDLCRDFFWYQGGGVTRRPTSRLTGSVMSRPSLEQTVARRVEALTNVTVRDRRGGLRPSGRQRTNRRVW